MYYTGNFIKYNPWKPPALIATASVVAGLALMGMVLGLGLGIGLNNGDQNLTSITTTTVNNSLITSTFSGTLTNSSSTYSPPHQPIPGHYYNAIRLTVATFGNYTIRSSSGINLYGYLYSSNFDPLNSSLNLIAFDDNSGGNQQFQMTVLLQSTSTTNLVYILVVTTFDANVTGSYIIIAVGPGSVQFSLTTTTTSVTSVTTTAAETTEAAQIQGDADSTDTTDMTNVAELTTDTVAA